MKINQNVIWISGIVILLFCRVYLKSENFKEQKQGLHTQCAEREDVREEGFFPISDRIRCNLSVESGYKTCFVSSYHPIYAGKFGFSELFSRTNLINCMNEKGEIGSLEYPFFQVNTDAERKLLDEKRDVLQELKSETNDWIYDSKLRQDAEWRKAESARKKEDERRKKWWKR